MKSSTQADYLPVREYMKMLQELSISSTGKPPRWIKEMPKEYPHVHINSKYWNDAHEWCKNVVGEEHYSWTGYEFFFTHKKDAEMFRLCFGV